MDLQLVDPLLSVDGESCQTIGGSVALHVAWIDHDLDTACGTFVWIQHLNLKNKKKEKESADEPPSVF